MATNTLAYASPLIATAIPVVPVGASNNSKQHVLLKAGASVTPQINEQQISALVQQGFTRGLARSLDRNIQAFPHRIWVVDNSGSMQRTDGHRIVDTLDRASVKIVQATRWEEIRECVSYHIRMASLLTASTNFRVSKLD